MRIQNFSEISKVIPTLRVDNETLQISLDQGILYHRLSTPAQPFMAGGEEYSTEEPGLRIRQLALPLNALPWLVDTIETGFWKDEIGMLTLNIFFRHTQINNENLRICFIPNCGAEATKGVIIENNSRPGTYLKWQEMGFSYQTLQEAGLLNFWKKIAHQYEKYEI